MKNLIMLFFFTLLSILFSCSNETTDEDMIIEEEPNINLNALYFPPVSSDEWETASIEDLDWNAAEAQPLYDFLEERNTKAFILLKNGRIVVEQYFNGVSVSDDSNPWYSAGKTLSAFTVGLAQQEGLLDINESSATYLGTQWADITVDQEQAITIRNHLTMTTGLDYTNVLLQNCTNVNCFTFLNEPGDFWYYHNAPYTLINTIVEGAVSSDFDTYFNSRLRDQIGMDGSWLNIGFNSIYHSTARSMARFGLLNLNKGSWDSNQILTDQNYFTEMINTSQDLNQSYGYLWWLNGKTNFRVPTLEIEFPGKLIADAPDDLIAGLGKDDQKLYIVPSQNLVIIRLGDDTGESLLGPSSFDNELWIRINALIN